MVVVLMNMIAAPLPTIVKLYVSNPNGVLGIPIRSVIDQHAVNVEGRLSLGQEIVERKLLFQRQQLANYPSLTVTAENAFAVVAQQIGLSLFVCRQHDAAPYSKWPVLPLSDVLVHTRRDEMAARKWFVLQA